MKQSDMLRQIADGMRENATPTNEALSTKQAEEVEAVMAQTPAKIETPEWTEVAAELSRLQAHKREIEAKITEVKARVLDAVAAGELEEGDAIKGPDGKVAVSIRHGGSRFDPIKAAQVLPEPLIEMVTVTTIDSKVAKAKLPPDMYRKCMTDGKTTITVK